MRAGGYCGVDTGGGDGEALNELCRVTKPPLSSTSVTGARGIASLCTFSDAGVRPAPSRKAPACVPTRRRANAAHAPVWRRGRGTALSSSVSNGWRRCRSMCMLCRVDTRRGRLGRNEGGRPASPATVDGAPSALRSFLFLPLVLLGLLLFSARVSRFAHLRSIAKRGRRPLFPTHFFSADPRPIRPEAPSACGVAHG